MERTGRLVTSKQSKTNEITVGAVHIEMNAHVVERVGAEEVS